MGKLVLDCLHWVESCCVVGTSIAALILVTIVIAIACKKLVQKHFHGR